jgi:glycogen debranching enzyme
VNASADDQARIPRATDLTGTLVLKHDVRFLLTDAYGDLKVDSRGLGLYQGDTRFLSRYELRINGSRPLVLRTGGGGGYAGAIQMTNPDLVRTPLEKGDAEDVLHRQSLGITRERALSDGFGERIGVRNYTTHPERCRLTLSVDADYADIFEVRGLVRAVRGERLPDELTDEYLAFVYRGTDDVVRRTRLRFSEVPASAAVAAQDDGPGRLVAFDWNLQPGEHRSLEVWVAAEEEPSDQASASRARAWSAQQLPSDEAEAAHRAWHASSTSVSTPHAAAERAFRRGLSDLRLLVGSGPGPDERYVAAGVPWYNALFGRDSLITALQLVAIRPQIARDTLIVLARLQADRLDDWRDAEPGKILHELRVGELARSGEIPHTPYYGTVDATPLWLMLLGAYESWTADRALIDRLWPNALACLDWIDSYGDLDGDGFVEYSRRSPKGLLNQGWKDSAEGIRWRDGRLVEGPVALVEAQAYVFAARMEVARLARIRGDHDLAQAQQVSAEALRARFEDAFWLEQAGTYAMALDRRKRAVDAVASNAGHALWCGIASPERAGRVTESLLGPELFSGWGIRTLSTRTAGYNPIGYHLGTVWPHDNAICAAGLWRYGFRREASRIAGALLEATQYFRDARLPELFCGFDRADSPYPVPYPVACSPQAWAAGSLFHLLVSMLGLEPDAASRELRLLSPALPDWLPELRLENLRVGDAVVDLLVRRNDGSTGVEVLRRSGELDVVVRV